MTSDSCSFLSPDSEEGVPVPLYIFTEITFQTKMQHSRARDEKEEDLIVELFDPQDDWGVSGVTELTDKLTPLQRQERISPHCPGKLSMA